MVQATNADEYRTMFQANHKITGVGAGVQSHFPCPFCAAPGWLVMPITDGVFDYPVMRGGATCKECGRSAKFIIERTAQGVQSECVQTGGDDPPEWLTPKMRRV